MAVEEKPAARGAVATVVATAAVTLAIAVTAAALGGYLVPARDGDRAASEQAAERNVAEVQRDSTSAPRVVLVPVAPDSVTEPDAPAAAPEMLLAGYERSDHDAERDHHQRHHDRRGKHHEHDEDHHDDE